MLNGGEAGEVILVGEEERRNDWCYCVAGQGGAPGHTGGAPGKQDACGTRGAMIKLGVVIRRSKLAADVFSEQWWV